MTTPQRSLSPIVLFVYNRLEHTKQTIDALVKNDLAAQSELFIYSDGPKNKDSQQAVLEIRNFLQTISGFKKVVIIERETNWGLAASIIDGVTKIVY
ncbi:MAG: glycosyltransferase, partial [SAR324 cluster bacterium]|nr:glycosyltransferase [SAR324 cluster bacterium]